MDMLTVSTHFVYKMKEIPLPARVFTTTNWGVKHLVDLYLNLGPNCDNLANREDVQNISVYDKKLFMTRNIEYYTIVLGVTGINSHYFR